MYTEQKIKAIISSNRYSETAVYLSLLRQAGITYAELTRGDIDVLRNKAQQATVRVFTSSEFRVAVLHAVNRKIIERKLSNYYKLQENQDTIEDYIDIEIELNKLSKRDKSLVLGFYTSKYSFSELEKIAKKRGLKITRLDISKIVNDIVDNITDNLTERDVDDE